MEKLRRLNCMLLYRFPSPRVMFLLGVHHHLICAHICLFPLECKLHESRNLYLDQCLVACDQFFSRYLLNEKMGVRSRCVSLWQRWGRIGISIFREGLTWLEQTAVGGCRNKKGQTWHFHIALCFTSIWCCPSALPYSIWFVCATIN